MAIGNHILIGLGGTGGRVLKELRKRLFDEQGKIPADIGFMYIDSSNELMQYDDASWLSAEGHNAQFSGREYLDISLRYPDSFTGVLPHFPNLKGIIENCERLKTYQSGCGAMQDRRLGRILLGIHADDFDRLLQNSVHDLQEQTLCGDLNVTIVTGLSGGTGSGCVVSVIARILKLHPDIHVTVMATLPTIPPPPRYDIGRYSANAYAALKELNALNIGRLQLSDLVTGEKFQPEMPYDNTLNNCHRLQENKLFRLFVFESFYNEYNKVSNILYHNLTHEPGNMAEETSRRHINMYNTITEPECDASASEGEFAHARTKAVGLLRLYRLVYPRQQILRHVAYNIAEQSYTQLLSNHFVGLGYIDEPLPTMPIDMRDLERWEMDEAHLTLDKTSDYMHQHVRRFRDEWEDVSIFITDEVKAAGGRSLMRDMAERFHDYYDCRFRNEGVDIYFHNATASIRYHADHCMGKYESHVLSLLMAGERGVYNVIDETNGFIRHLQSLLQETEMKEKECSENIALCQTDINEITNNFESSSILLLAIRRDGYIRQIKGALTYLYEEKTRHRALAYESQLIAELIVRAQELVANLEELKHVLTDRREEARHMAQEEKEVPPHTLYVVNLEKVRQFKAKLFGCRPVMERLAALTRDSIFREEQSIQRLVNDMHNDLMTLHLKSLYYETILQFDSEQNALERLFSTGILEEILRASIDRNRLTKMLGTAISAACVRALLNDNELLRAIRNNPLPTEIIVGPGRTTALIRIPQPTNGHEEELSEWLTAEVRALENHDWQMEINSRSSNRDEISIASVCTNFPLRCLKSLSGIKQQYDDLIASNGLQAMHMLHTEDSFTDLPSLEVETIQNQIEI